MKNTYKILVFLSLFLLASCSTKTEETGVNSENGGVGSLSGQILEMESGNTGGGGDDANTQNDAIRF